MEEMCGYLYWLKGTFGEAGAPPLLCNPQEQMPGDVRPQGGDNDPVALLLKYIRSCLAALEEKGSLESLNHCASGPSAPPASGVVPYMPSPFTDMAVPSLS